MKKLNLLLLAIVISLGIGTVAYANVYTFTPPVSADLGDLDHLQYYLWGINLSLAPGEQIESATLTYNNIYNGDANENHLYTHLLDSVPVGLQQGYDGVSFGDQFVGQGLLLGDYTDPIGGPSGAINLVYTIPDTHYSWLQDGNFGFGIDPDCHYYNDAVVLRVVTPVPEPTSMMLLGMGILGLFGLKRKS